MNPLVISTPRTVSSLFVRKLFSLARHNWGHQSLLYEYFNLSREYWVLTKTVDNVVYYDRTIRNHSGTAQFQDPTREIFDRIKILRDNPVYLVKIHAAHINDQIYDFLNEKNHDLIYIHRRDRLNQLLSFLAAVTNKIWIHSHKVNKQIKEIVYHKNTVEHFFHHLDKFFEIRNKLPGIDVYAEDFILHGGDESAVIKIMGLPAQLPIDCQTLDLVPTPYINHDKESLIVNQLEWLEDKPKILESLAKYC